MDAKVHWYRVVCTCVAGGGLWLSEGQMLRGEELGDHLSNLLDRGALVPVKPRRESRRAQPVVDRPKTFSLR